MSPQNWQICLVESIGKPSIISLMIAFVHVMLFPNVNPLWDYLKLAMCPMTIRFPWLNQSHCQRNIVESHSWTMNYMRGLGKVNFARGTKAQQPATLIQNHGEVE